MNTIIGIIGGAGPLASVLLYKKIIEKSYEIRSSANPKLILVNYPFTISMLKYKKKTSKALEECLRSLKQCGAQRIVIACNSLHAFLPQDTTNESVLVKLPQAVLAQAQRNNQGKILVLGTDITLGKNLYAGTSVTCVAPLAYEQDLVRDIIQRILAGIIIQEDAHTLDLIIKRVYTEELITGAVLGCTDLSVLHAQFPLCSFAPHLLLDSLEIVADYLVNQKL